MSGRIVSAEEARAMHREPYHVAAAEVRELAHTVVTQAEQIAAAVAVYRRIRSELAEARPSTLGIHAVREDVAAEMARALGVTE